MESIRREATVLLIIHNEVWFSFYSEFEYFGTKSNKIEFFCPNIQFLTESYHRIPGVKIDVYETLIIFVQGPVK